MSNDQNYKNMKTITILVPVPPSLSMQEEIAVPV